MVQNVNAASGTGVRRRLKERLREATRAAILDAAESVYAEQGFEAGRMEQVARRAGVSVGTLYNYFADRKSLVASLLDERRAELLRRVDDALSVAPAATLERLRALLVSSFEHFEAHRPFVSLLMQEGVTEWSTPLPGRVSRSTSVIRDLAARAHAVLAEARGRHTDADLDLMAMLFVGGLRAGILHAVTRTGAVEPRAMADQILGWFVDGTGVS